MRSPRDLDVWAASILDRLARGQVVEDWRVELKSEWIEPASAARRIAAHANAAHGVSVLWLIGVDEKRGIVGVAPRDMADWYRRVSACFVGDAPTMIDSRLEVDGKAIVALGFETSRAPFLVRNPLHGTPSGGSIEHEVPFRRGTETRTATRTDLLRILVHSVSLPEIEVVGGGVRLWGEPELQLFFDAAIFIAPGNDTVVVYPVHWITITARLPGQEQLRLLSGVNLTSLGAQISDDQLRVASEGAQQLVVRHAVRASISASGRSGILHNALVPSECTIEFVLRPVQSSLATRARLKFVHKGDATFNLAAHEVGVVQVD